MNKMYKKRLIVTTSTLPRWKGDAVPSFVLDHSRILSPGFNEVVILAPHAKGAKRNETISPNITVRRVRYFWPAGAQDIFYDGGAGERVSTSPIYALKALMYMASLMINTAKLRPDKNTILNPNWVLPQGVVAIICKQIFRRSKVVVTARGTDIFSLNGKLPTALKRFVLKNADNVVVNSGLLKEACEKIYSREYIVQPTGYDATLFKPKKIIKKKKNSCLKLITVGRLVEYKGFMDILKSVMILKRQNIKVELLIVGEGPEREDLENFINSHNIQDIVMFTGWVSPDELVVLYQKADVYVGAPKPSAGGKREAFGNVYTEAMACGTPVIVTTAAGASEIIKNGVNGFVVEPNSSDEIAQCVEMLYHNPDRLFEMSHEAIKASKPYSKSATKDRYLQIFNEL